MNKVSTVLKRLAAAVLAGAMLLMLAGCGQRSQDDEVTKAQTEDVTTAEEQTSAPETSTEATETEPTTVTTTAPATTTAEPTTVSTTAPTTVSTTAPTTVTTTAPTTKATAAPTTVTTTATTAATEDEQPQFSLDAELVNSRELGLEASGSLARAYKTVGNTNPISSNVFFADPTAVEYNGRLYVYGTCDSQEYIKNGGQGENTYGSINSLACFSTADMKNWTYHGDIPVGQITGWAWCSWAPSIVSKETDGKTTFYLYFANSAGGIGVLTSDSPTGPWEDPLGHALISPNTNELASDPVFWCFDPGVCIDDNGVGWMVFGGGDPMHDGESGLYTGNCRLVRLGEDMISLDSEMIVIDAPYHFEANELNFINGKYVLTYCSNWFERTEWPSEYKYAKPELCTMCYMVSDDPLDPDSWEYMGEYIKNPTGYGYPFSNNHTHLQEFKGNYYIFYQNVLLLRNMNVQGAGGYRSVGVDELDVDEQNVTFPKATMTDRGASQIELLDPFEAVQGETSNVSAGVTYTTSDKRFCAVMEDGSWIALCGVDFADGASSFAAVVDGKGALEIRLDSEKGRTVGSIQFDTDGFAAVTCELDETVTGEHDLYLVAGADDSFELDMWQFAK